VKSQIRFYKKVSLFMCVHAYSIVEDAFDLNKEKLKYLKVININ